MSSRITNEQFWKQGYELLPPCLTDDELIGALEAIDDWLKNVASVNFQFIQDISRDDRFTRLIQNEIVHKRVTELLGSPPRIYYSHFIVSKATPNKRMEVDEWHMDKDLDNGCVKAAFYLTDVSKEGSGNTYIKPGSMNSLMNPEITPIPVLTPERGVLLYRPKLWHSRSTNCSNIVRKVVFLSCQRSI